MTSRSARNVLPLPLRPSAHEAPESVLLVAVEEGEVVGDGNLAGSTRPRLAHREELGISVRRSHWHRGIGTRLLRAQPKAPGPFGC
ncbi:GNAT family N-acetyltransferase [Collinsella sp. AF08-23]|nr:GNAT family N-acetyltransferase [Collinsella sp. AF08-23]